MTVKVLSCTESNLLVHVHAGVYVCVKVSDCIRVLTFVSECVCVCVCVCVWMLVKVGVCLLTEVSQHCHDYPPAETNYKMTMTLVMIHVLISK